MALSTITNVSLTDELEAIEAIYGQGTIKVSSTSTKHTSIELRPPATTHGFFLTFPALYPEHAPAITGVDSLRLSLELAPQENLLYLRLALFHTFQPGQVCLYDMMERYLEILRKRQLLENDNLANFNNLKVVHFDEEMKQLASSVTNTMDKARASAHFMQVQLDLLSSGIVGCSVCLEPVFRSYSATLRCKHSYCIPCLQDGIRRMMKGNGEFRCCGSFIPALLVQRFGDLSGDLLRAYSIFLSERNAKDPLYCAERRCSTFIPSYLHRDGLAKCIKCDVGTCLRCRAKKHVGVCGYEVLKLHRMATQFHWQFCPACGHCVERTMGCDHMVCHCGMRFCYKCGQQQDQCICHRSFREW